MQSTSFLHAASARALADGGNSSELAGPLRLLLVEEGGGNAARSLAMDAACSLAAHSSIPCRGCGADDAACRCCRVAILVPGEPKGGRRKRRRKNAQHSQFLGDGEGDEVNGIDGQQQWDPSVLGHVQIKYVSSLKEVLAYLAYAPSLPDHRQPLEGIFILGAGELLSREATRTSMEFTHLLSLLADAASVLEEKRAQVMRSNVDDIASGRLGASGGVSVVATMDKYAYSSMSEKVIRYAQQWMDFVASVEPQTDAMPDANGEPATGWELLFQNVGALEPLPDSPARVATEGGASFGFQVRAHEREDSMPGHLISWNV
ncbi:hypothetical protein ACHAXT_004081 [Thalassiosira profunda]